MSDSNGTLRYGVTRITGRNAFYDVHEVCINGYTEADLLSEYQRLCTKWGVDGSV